MQSNDTVNPKNPPAKQKFSSYLRAIETDRLNAANESGKDKPLLLQRRIKSPDYSVTNVRLLQATGVLVSAIWLAGAALYIQRTVGWSNVSSLMPHELGGFLAGILTPIALFWMIAAFILRSNDVKMYAEALREEIQTIIFPSEEADRRVNNDIERLARQTEHMAKATKTMLHAIAEAREGLKGQVQALNGTSDQTLDRLSKLGQSLSERTKEVTGVSNQLNQTITHFNQHTAATNQWIDKLKSANEQIGKQANMVDQSTEKTEQAVARLSTMLRERLEGLGSLHQQTEDALKAAAVEMATQRDQFRIEASTIEEKAKLVSDALQRGAGKMYEFTDDALDKAKMIETRLQGHASSLEQVLKLASNGAQEIEAKTVDAVAKLDNAQNIAVDRSQKLQNILQQAIDRLVDRSQAVSQEANKLITDATTQLEERSQFVVHQAQTSLTDAATRMINDVDAVSEKAKTLSNQMLDEVNRKVADTSAAFVYIQKQIQALVSLFDQRKTHLDEAGAGARDTADSLQKSLQTALDKVRDMSTQLQQSISGIEGAVQKPVALLEAAVSHAYLKAGDMGEMLQTRANTLTQSAEQIGSNVSALHDKLHSKGQDVALLAGKIATHLQTVSQELSSQNDSLDGKTRQSLENLQALMTLQTTLLENLGRMDAQSASAQQQIKTLQQYHVALSEDATTTEAKLGQVSDRLIHISGAAVDKVKAALDSMNAMESDYSRLSASGIDSLGRIDKAYRETLEQAQIQAEKTQNAVQQQVVQIVQSADMLQNTAQNIARTTDDTVTKIMRVQDAGQGIQMTLQQVKQSADAFDASVAGANQNVSVHVKSLQDAAGALETLTTATLSNLVRQGQALEQHTQTHIASLEKSFDNASGFTSRLRDYLGQLNTDTMGLEEKLSQSVTRLLSHGNQIDASTTRLMDRISQAQSELQQQDQELQHRGDRMLDQLTNAAQHIGDKASALEQAAQMAMKQAETLREQESKMKRDAFFSSTKFVVESLHSLALDFTRLLDGELPEKTWRSYQKGDTGSFTRRLLSVRDEETQNKIKTKYTDDHEFRTYVQRYLRQFEEIYDQAASNDHADLLTTIFMTSDVGKLYKFLCSVLDREARGPAAASLAA